MPLRPPPIPLWTRLSTLPIANLFRRVLGRRPRYEIWSDASKGGYGGHLGPAHRPTDVFRHQIQPAVSPPPPPAPVSVFVSTGSSDDPASRSPPDDLAPLHLSIDPRLLTTPPTRTDTHEAIAVYKCLERWAPRIRGGIVICHLDNFGVCEWLIAKGAPRPRPSASTSTSTSTGLIEDETGGSGSGSGPVSSDSKTTAEVVKAILHLVEEADIELEAKWVSRRDNKLADGLSRPRRIRNTFFTPRVRRLMVKSAMHTAWEARRGRDAVYDGRLVSRMQGAEQAP